MNIRDLALNFLFAAAMSACFFYFFSPKKGDVLTAVNQNEFIASDFTGALRTEVDFIDTKRKSLGKNSEIVTDWGNLTFSTDGATLQSLEFKQANESSHLLRTIFPLDESARERQTLLVALDSETPYFYELVSQDETDDLFHLQYKAKETFGSIQKLFTIHKKKHQIDLEISIDGFDQNTGSVRLFFESPVLAELGESDIISALMVNQNGTFEKTERSKLNEHKGWIKPHLFGTEDRYFIHAVIQDQDHFVQRSYYNLHGKMGLLTILEAKIAPKQEKRWKLSFYFGPKDSDAIMQVDSRLEDTLEYSGIFAPISRLLLKLLKWLHAYIHNYGLAIIVLTFLIKLILLPFSWRSEQSMKKQRELQKKMAYLQQRYKNEPERLNQEKAELIKKHGMPGLMGCLPILIQMPLFIALSRVLNSSIALYQAPMLWIPDLSARDPYYILPFFIMLSMLAMAFTANKQQQVSLFVMAVVFGAVSANFSAGLSLYICVSTLLGFLQTKLINSVKETA